MSAHSGYHVHHVADAPANATYGNFTSDRIFRSPTDLNWIIARVLVLNDTDTATAYNFAGNITLSPYNTAGTTAYFLLSVCKSNLCCVVYQLSMPTVLHHLVGIPNCTPERQLSA